MSVILRGARAATLAAGAPELPRVYLDTTYTRPTGRTIAVAAGGDLQAAINQSQFGDVITLQAGAVFTGNFTLPKKSSSGQTPGWITIRTSTPDSSFPQPGVRVSPANSPLMPKIVSPNDNPAISADLGAHHYRFIGLEVGVKPGVNIYVIVDFDGDPRSLTEMAHDLIVDRCYIHGNDTDASRRGVSLNCGATAVIDSHLSNIHEPEADSQAICGWNGSGPFKIVNNYLEAAGEIVMFGGADSVIQGLTPSDIEFRRNHLAKPLSWKIGDAAYAGNKWAIKNLFELKNAQRLFIDRNVFEYTWGQSQDGTAILFTPVNQSGTNPWAVVQDVTFTNNIVRHAGNGFNISGDDAGGGSEPSRRILIKNNLLDDIDKVRWGWPDGPSDGEFVQLIGGEDVTIEHNTVFQNGNIISTDARQSPRLIFRNNIIPHNSYGVWGSGIGLGNDAINYYFPGAIFVKNVMVGAPQDVKYPADNFLLASFSQVGFVNQAAGDYRLAASSPYINAATDGTNIGCNIDALLSDTTAVSVQAASYRDTALAVESIIAAFGTELSNETAIAPMSPLPTTLSGTTVKVRDALGTERLAPLFFVSPTQVNYLIPLGTAYGQATILISNAKGATALSQAKISQVAPGLFTADSSGKGLPTGNALRIRNNTQSYEPIARFDPLQSKWVAAPIDLSEATDQVYLILYGTGVRNRTALNAVSASIGGVSGQVSFAGAQGGFDGLDQINVLLPRSLAGRGGVDVILTVDGQPANTVWVNFK
jgi:uncharacterized protein (TIGR03437 family)